MVNRPSAQQSELIRRVTACLLCKPLAACDLPMRSRQAVLSAVELHMTVALSRRLTRSDARERLAGYVLESGCGSSQIVWGVCLRSIHPELHPRTRFRAPWM